MIVRGVRVVASRTNLRVPCQPVGVLGVLIKTAVWSFDKLPTISPDGLATSVSSKAGTTTLLPDTDFIITTDKNTFAKYAERAKKAFGAKFKTVLFDANTKFSPSLFDTEIELETWAKEHNV